MKNFMQRAASLIRTQQCQTASEKLALIEIADKLDTLNLQEWVSITERHPDEKGQYLVAYYPCYWDDVDYRRLFVGLDSYRGKASWAKKKYQRVAYWMPKPTPPAGFVYLEEEEVYRCPSCKHYGEPETCKECRDFFESRYREGENK